MARAQLWLDDYAFTVDPGDALNLRSLGVWYDSPAVKFQATARVAGDGGFEPRDVDINYAARTVAFSLVAVCDTREEATRLMMELGGLLHRTIRVRVKEGEYDLWSRGYVTFAFPTVYNTSFEFTATVVCQNPAKYAMTPSTTWLTSKRTTGGLRYPFHYPVVYSPAASASNSGVLTNNGTADAYPTITVEGNLPAGFSLFLDGHEVSYTSPVYLGSPVVIDYREETAAQGGVQRSVGLRSRDFTAVPKASTSSLLFVPATATTEAWAKAEIYDTYI